MESPYDDFDSVMRKLELSAASLAEVATSRDRNIVTTPPNGHSLGNRSSSYTLFPVQIICCAKYLKTWQWKNCRSLAAMLIISSVS